MRATFYAHCDDKPLQMFVDACAKATGEECRARARRDAVRSRIGPDLLARVWVGERIAVLRWWVEQESPYLSAEEVVRMLLDLALRGRYWAGGFESQG
ncbi:hypothetical protein RCO28_01380 [Streptomyces sp. LHD-70]|uniref:hypothetical protein n=1 Tax=Streptomyces sp. LHD-70 TaxID=3072140 RepID=UPI00280CB64C|nr:hypothetical protein [Streptomyces sp. LHD-70]MDQ8701139.1 hypothetical protein [Streptomyces sp. LHD-70]